MRGEKGDETFNESHLDFRPWTSRVRSPSPALYIEVMLMRNKEIKATLEAVE
jgi:hypothetical protein